MTTTSTDPRLSAPIGPDHIRAFSTVITPPCKEAMGWFALTFDSLLSFEKALAWATGSVDPHGYRYWLIEQALNGGVYEDLDVDAMEQVLSFIMDSYRFPDLMSVAASSRISTWGISDHKLPAVHHLRHWYMWGTTARQRNFVCVLTEIYPWLTRQQPACADALAPLMRALYEVLWVRMIDLGPQPVKENTDETP